MLSLRHLANIFFVGWWLFIVTSYGVLTTWFKYSPGLVGVVAAIIYFIPVSILVLSLWLISSPVQRKQKLFQIIMMLVVIVASVYISYDLGINYLSPKSWQLNRIYLNHSILFRTGESQLRYSHKSVNPGSAVSRDYLVIENKGKKDEFPLTWQSPGNIDDVNFSVPVLLYPTSTKENFTLEVYGLSNANYFNIDLTKKTATYLVGKSLYSGSCDVSGKGYKNNCSFFGDKLFFSSDKTKYLGFGVLNALSDRDEVLQYKFVHLALGGDHNYFLPFGSPDDPLPILKVDDLTSWGKIINISNALLIVETFNRAGNHKLKIDLDSKLLVTIE